jgi:hypothetical protein
MRSNYSTACVMYNVISHCVFLRILKLTWLRTFWTPTETKGFSSQDWLASSACKIIFRRYLFSKKQFNARFKCWF